jgi:hypothetical protein
MDTGLAPSGDGAPLNDSSALSADSAPDADASPSSAVEVPGPSASLLASHVYGQGIGKVYDCVTNYYVDGATGSDRNDGTTATTSGGHGPWLTIQHADSLPRSPGDCINVAPGTYDWTPTYTGWAGFAITHGGSSASPTGYVTYRCEELDACYVLLNAAGTGFTSETMIDVAAPYLVIDGFELDGGEGQTYGGWASTCIASGASTGIGHHVWVLNNKVHGCNLGGISLSDGEWYFAIHNEVYDNAWSSGYEGSGMGFVVEKALGSDQPIINGSYSLYTTLPPYPAYTATPQDDGFAPFHILVLWNKVHDNGCTTCLGSTATLTTTANVTSGSTALSGLSSMAGLIAHELVVGPGVPPLTYVASISGSTVTLTRAATSSTHGSYTFSTLAGGHTDGNGIIMDTWCALDPSGQCGTPGGTVVGNTVTYPYQALIAFNDVENNGGRGIHVFASNNITVANNSTYDNGLDGTGTGWTELSEVGGQNNTWLGNNALAVLAGNYAVVAGDGRGATSMNNTYEHNVVYGGLGVGLYNNDTTYWMASSNAAVNPQYAAPSQGDPGDLTLQSSSKAVGYAYAWSLLAPGDTNAGAYQNGSTSQSATTY